MTDQGWTEDRVTTLKKLWLDGLSAGQITKQLGGVSRSAVIGKVHRLGLSGRATPSRPVVRRQPSGQNKRAAAQANAAMRSALAAVAAPPPEPFIDPTFREGEVGAPTALTLGAHMCKWPIGDPSNDGFSFCGRRVGDDGPYCVEHARIAYQPNSRQDQDRVKELARSLRRWI